MKLEVGTEITERHGGKIVSIKKITRVTEKRAFVKVSDTYSIPFKIESDPDGKVRDIGADSWSKLPGETVYKIIDLLNERTT